MNKPSRVNSAWTIEHRSPPLFKRLGPKTLAKFHDRFKEPNLIATDDELYMIAEALSTPTQWSDEQAELALDAYATLSDNKRDEERMVRITKWILVHPNDAEAVRLCMSICPPKGYRIERVVSRDTGQKLVFEAVTDFTSSKVILKYFRTQGEGSDRTFNREMLV